MTGPTVEASLAPVRQALLAAARRDAARIRAAARADARRVLADAADRARAITAEARDQGAAMAERMAAADLARSRRAARAIVLRAERESYEALRAAARAAVARLVEDPGYPVHRAAMVRALRRTLGPDVVVTDHRDGGVSGAGDHRRIDYSLGGLADRALRVVLAERADPP
jgi:hypothetical protein